MSRHDEERHGSGPIGGRGMSGAVGGGLARIERERRREAAAGATQGRARLGLRLSVMATLSLGLLTVLLLRLYSVQVLRAGSYRKNALQEVYKDVYTPAPRGEIVTRDGAVLATDAAEEVVTIKPAIDGKTWVASNPTGEANVASLLGISESQIDADLNSDQNVPYQPVVIAIGPSEGVSEQAVVQISENPGRYPGVSVSRQFVRSYPEASLAAQVLGYTGEGPATVGYTAKGSAVESPLDLAEYAKYGNAADPTFGEQGLEEQYQKYLFGTPGIEREAVDPTGNPLAIVSSTPPVQGDTVVLNMDMGLEKALASDLSSDVAGLRAGSGGLGDVLAPDAAGVVMDVRTGAILALASYPSYNDNLWVGGISSTAYKQLEDTTGSPLNDYAVADPQPPGSDWKLNTATAALDDGLISPYYTYDDPGSYTIGNLTLHDAPGEVPGVIDLSMALTESSDVFFYNLGAMFYEAWSNDPKGYPYGETPIQDEAAKYGFGTTDAVDLPPLDVSTGQVDTPALEKALGNSTWTLGDNMEMAFGQGATEITPLQLVDAYSAFANNGVRLAPELAAEIVSPSGKVLKRFSPTVTGRISYASSADYQAILAGFQGVTQNPLGTGYQAFVGFPFNKWNVYGKTGTATVTESQQPTSWFVSFGGPRGQAPQYAVAIEVNQGGYGAAASAPVAREMFDYLYAHGVPPVAPGS